MSDKPIHLAVDVGQTSTTLRLLGAGTPDLTVGGVDTSRPLPPQWAGLVLPVLAGFGGPVHTVAIASTGLGRETAHDVLPLLAEAGVRRVILAHDSVSCYLGALGDLYGCVVMAGTGTITIAVGPKATARVDGWGHLVGDAGSAYWIGRTALEAALRGHDGRRQMTALTHLMAREFDDIENAHLELQAQPDRVARIASFSAMVNDLAATDRVAGNILDKAAAHLSEAVQAAIRRAHLTGPNPPRVAAIGGVFGSQRVLRRFTDYLSLQWPSFAIFEPIGETVDGVATMLTLPPSHPLYPMMTVAER